MRVGGARFWVGFGPILGVGGRQQRLFGQKGPILGPILGLVPVRPTGGCPGDGVGPKRADFGGRGRGEIGPILGPICQQQRFLGVFCRF